MGGSCGGLLVRALGFVVQKVDMLRILLGSWFVQSVTSCYVVCVRPSTKVSKWGENFSKCYFELTEWVRCVSNSCTNRFWCLCLLRCQESDAPRVVLRACPFRCLRSCLILFWVCVTLPACLPWWNDGIGMFCVSICDTISCSIASKNIVVALLRVVACDRLLVWLGPFELQLSINKCTHCLNIRLNCWFSLSIPSPEASVTSHGKRRIMSGRWWYAACIYQDVPCVLLLEVVQTSRRPSARLWMVSAFWRRSSSEVALTLIVSTREQTVSQNDILVANEM